MQALLLHLDSGETYTQPPPPEHWQGVLEHVALSGEQRRDLAAVHGVYAGAMQVRVRVRVRRDAGIGGGMHACTHTRTAGAPCLL